MVATYTKLFNNRRAAFQPFSRTARRRIFLFVASTSLGYTTGLAYWLHRPHPMGETRWAPYVFEAPPPAQLIENQVAQSGSRVVNNYEVCVVGAGFAGLATALAAAERGMSVVLLTNARVGTSRSALDSFGVSCVLPQQHNLPPVGDDPDLNHVERGYVKLRELVERYNIDCDLREVNGIFYSAQDARSSEAAAAVLTDVVDGRRDDIEVVVNVDAHPQAGLTLRREKTEIKKRDGISKSRGESSRAVLPQPAELPYVERCTVFNPKMLVQGMSRAIEERGGKILELCNVGGIVRGYDGYYSWTVKMDESGNGCVQTRYMVMCTGAPDHFLTYGMRSHLIRQAMYGVCTKVKRQCQSTTAAAVPSTNGETTSSESSGSAGSNSTVVHPSVLSSLHMMRVVRNQPQPSTFRTLSAEEAATPATYILASFGPRHFPCGWSRVFSSVNSFLGALGYQRAVSHQDEVDEVKAIKRQQLRDRNLPVYETRVRARQAEAAFAEVDKHDVWRDVVHYPAPLATEFGPLVVRKGDGSLYDFWVNTGYGPTGVAAAFGVGTVIAQSLGHFEQSNNEADAVLFGPENKLKQEFRTYRGGKFGELRNMFSAVSVPVTNLLTYAYRTHGKTQLLD